MTMLLNDQFPIDENYLLKQDRTLSFSGITWSDYEKFNLVEYPGYRTSFLDRVITIVSPSQNHEIIKDFCENIQRTNDREGWRGNLAIPNRGVDKRHQDR